MRYARIVSVILAAVLQVAPLTRTLITMLMPESPDLAVVFRWAVGAAAMLGGYDAVSGASTVITSPATVTGTNGVPFSFRFTTGPQVATVYTAAPLPPGLTLTASTGRITGTPTQVGVTVATVQGCDPGNGCTPTATLTITIVAGGAPATAPSITTPPASQTVTAGANVSFSVVASGTAPLSYQWRFNGVNISGATSATYALTNVQSGNAGAYAVVVSNAAGSVTSGNATLTVTPAAGPPSITTQPASQAVTVGANVSFTVVATGGAPLSYQWQFNGAAIAGATSATYALTNVQTNNAGSYAVMISNAQGSVTSASATLTVNPAPIAPVIITPPASQTAVAGGTVSFSVAVTGTAPLSYQWRFNGANLAGATSATLVLANAQAGNAGSYAVQVANAAGSVTSASATLTVNAPPVITAQPASRPANIGSSAMFTVTATGSAPLSYQWRFNGSDLAGATSASLAVSNVQTNQAGNYSVVVANAFGSVTSANATLTVQSVPSNLASTYNGLFYDTNGAVFASSGFVNVRVLSTGKYRGKLIMANQRWTIAGQFGAPGMTTNTFTTRDGRVITTAMQLDVTGGVQSLTGTVSDGTWTALIIADQPAATTPSPYTGSYQMALAGPGNPGGGGSGGGDGQEDSPASLASGQPTGLAGSATAVVDPRSNLRMTGKLNNGQKLAQQVPLSAQGDWPVWTSLGHAGALMGWLSITGPTAPVQGGQLLWLHPDGTVTPLTVAP